MSEGTWISLRLPSRVELAGIAHAAAQEVALQAGLDENGALDFALAVREAVVNAMIHGHGGDASLEVECRFLTREGRAEARVRDGGEGFDPSSLEDPRSPEGRQRPSGRGVLLMNSLVDETSYQFGDGTEVTLVKKAAEAS